MHVQQFRSRGRANVQIWIVSLVKNFVAKVLPETTPGDSDFKKIPLIFDHRTNNESIGTPTRVLSMIDFVQKINYK